TIDLMSRTIDARLTLSGPAEGGAPGTARPDLLIALQGPAASPQRSVDVSALVSWLMLRSLDRETRRMEAVEAGRHDPATPAPAAGPGNASRIEPEPMGANPGPQNEGPPGPLEKPEPAAGSLEQAPSLPPPVEIRPAPGTGPTRGARPKEGSPAQARPLRGERTVSSQPETRSIFDRLFGTHNYPTFRP